MPNNGPPTRPTRGPLVAEFIETFCRHSKGEWAGQPLRLQAWQGRLLEELFWLRPDGRRRHRTALIGLARKNGKSTLCAALALYGLVADQEPGAEVYSCAGDRKQAEIVFGEAKRMVRAEPELAALVRVQRYHLEVPATNGVYRVLSADATLQQGLSPSFVVFDEVHVQPDEELWTAMTLGSGTRRQPLVVGITTAGYDEASLAYRLYEYGRRVNAGEIDDPTFFFRWWQPTHSDGDYHDQAVWAEANPALRTEQTPDGFLELEDLEAAARLTPEHQFRRYRLDQWTKTADAWLPSGAWDACAAPDVALDEALPAHVGIDMAYSNDCAAVVIAQRVGERTVVRARVWENPYPPTHSEHPQWRINPLAVEAHCRELRQRFPAPAREVDKEIRPGPAYYYDPAWFQRSAPVLDGDGLNMVEWPQTDARMIPAAQTFYQLVTERLLAHDGDPILKRHVENAVADQRPRGWRISKQTARRKIDACIAAALAVCGAQEPGPTVPRSRFEAEGEGLLVL